MRREWSEEETAIERLRRERNARRERRMERAARENAAFWSRGDVRGARNALDVWASCKWARASGVFPAVPTLEAIFEFPRAETQIAGASVTELEFAAVTSTAHPEATPRLIELAIDGVLIGMGAGGIAVDLLTRLYPRTGTYQRPEYARDVERPLQDPEGAILRAYRPEDVTAIAAGILTPSIQKRLDSTLHQLHRELVLAVARAAALPADVYAAEIVSIRVPEVVRAAARSHPKNEKRKLKNPAGSKSAA